MNREIRKNSHYEILSHKKQVMTDIVVTLLVFALFLLSNLYSPKNTAFFGFDYAYRCMGISYTESFLDTHLPGNQTLQEIVSLFETVKVLSEYQRDFSVEELFTLFAVSLLLTTTP